MRLSRSLLLALAVIVIAQGLYFYPRMPESMASHFDGSGAPNGYQSKVYFRIVTKHMGARAGEIVRAARGQ